MHRRLTGRSARRRIAVLYDYGTAEAIPFLREPIAHLAAEGFGIDLVTPASHPYPSWAPIEGVRHLEVAGYGSRPNWSTASTLGRLAIRGVVRRDYAAILATPIVSVVVGAMLAAIWRVPLVVMSDELFTLRDQVWNPHPKWRGLMNRAHARAALTVITDLRRKAALVDDCPALDRQPYVELPNVPAELPQPGDRAAFRRTLGLAENTFVVLHAGSFNWFVRAPELVATLPSFPPGCAFVVQTNTQPEPTTVALCRLVERTQPFRFLADPLPYAQLDDVVTACDIGVAFYCGSSPNFWLCGKGSGKVNRCLRAGKPVIVDRGGGLEWIAEYGAGVAVLAAAELPDAIGRIMADYDRYAARARECHAEHLSFERHWKVVRSALAEVMDG